MTVISFTDTPFILWDLPNKIEEESGLETIQPLGQYPDMVAIQ